jgi:hypothetical protein
MKPLRYADGSRLIVVARNDDALQIIRPLRSNPAPAASDRMTSAR